MKSIYALLLIDSLDSSYVAHLKRLIPSKTHDVVLSMQDISSVTFTYLNNLAQRLRAMDPEREIVLITTNNSLLRKLIDHNNIWVDETRTNPVSANNWRGALFSKEELPPTASAISQVLFIPPVKHIFTLPEGKFLFLQYLNKIYKRENYIEPYPFSWRLLDTEQKCTEFYSLMCSQAILCSIDIETKKHMLAITCVGYALLLKDGTTQTGVIPMKELHHFKYMKLFNKTDVSKIFQNGRYDNIYFLRWNAPCVNWRYDTFLMNHALFSELPRKLGELSSFYLLDHKYWKDEKDGGSEQMHYEYNAKDAHRTLQVWLAQMKFIACNGQFHYAIDNYATQFPLVFPALQCEAEGILVDEQARLVLLADEGKTLEERLLKLQGKTKKGFNPSSPVQVKSLLRSLGAERLIEAHGTDADGMDMISFKSPVAGLVTYDIAEYRKARKLVTTYLDVDDKILSGRIFYSLDPGGTDTGRLASRESSFWCGFQIQNIPRVPKNKRSVKHFLRADYGYELGEVDLAQSESRCTGHLANCDPMIQACENSPDFHSFNITMFFGIPFDEVWDTEKRKSKNPDLRNLAKPINHGSNYNMGPGVLLTTMGIREVLKAQKVLNLPQSLSPYKVCEVLLSYFVKAYPQIKDTWYGELKREIAKTRKLVLPSLYKGLQGWTRFCFSDPLSSKSALNAYVAHKPQALSAQICCRAWYQSWAKYQSAEFRIKAQIHDSIFFQCAEGTFGRYSKLVQEELEVPVYNMPSGTFLKIPADTGGSGIYWGDLK